MSILAPRSAATTPAPEVDRERSVVAWNGSRSARSALAWAAARERRRNGELTLLRVLEDAGGFRPRSDVERALEELDAELKALRKAFPGLAVSAELRAGSAEEVLPAIATGPALLVVGSRSVGGEQVRSPWSLGMRLLAGARASVVLVPTEIWSWRTGVVASFRGPVDGAAVLFAAEQAQANDMPLTLVVPEQIAREADDRAGLVAEAFPGLRLDVISAAAVAPVLIGLARSAALVVAGSDQAAAHGEPLRTTLAAASEAPVAVIRAPRLRHAVAAPARSARSRF
jgi:Universal stress protein family